MNRSTINKALTYTSAFVVGATLGVTLGVVLRTQKDVLMIMAMQNEIAKKVLDLD